MITVSTTLRGVNLLYPPRYDDKRGSFRPVYAERFHQQAGYSHNWAEMNLTHSEPNCVRGLHFQQPNAQAKLVFVVSGSIFDVVVDIRPESNTYGKWESFTLSADSPDHPSQIYIPAGYAHGLATPDGPATIAYLVSEPWHQAHEQVLQWNDPLLAIPWPVQEPNLSVRDQQGLSLEDIWQRRVPSRDRLHELH